MTLFQRNRWFVAAAGFSLAFAVVSFTAKRSPGLTAFADFAGLAIMVIAAAVACQNAFIRPVEERSFWWLMALGFSLWACNQGAWFYHEVIFKTPIPDPYFYDIVLFFHSVPMIAAIGWRPDLAKRRRRLYLSILNFLMLMGWWIFLYAFIIFPYQYVNVNVKLYDIWYDRVYGLQNVLLLITLGLAWFTSSGGWRRLYRNFFAVAVLYGINSQFLDRAAANETYYSGSPYDIALILTVAWLAAVALSAREWDLQTVEFSLNLAWKKLIPQLALLAMLSLPVLGLWTILADKSPGPTREFRIFAVLAAMLFLGGCVFLRQYLQDQALINLLEESRRGYDNQKRLQSQLVQKEKLASLGALVAGAAHEINRPLTAIMSQSEQLFSQEGLTEEQNVFLRKIVNQARRTSDLVTDLLSFAQQAPGEKVLVDLALLLNRATQMLDSRHAGGNIRVQISVQPNLPRVQGNANQLFQAFVEIIDNAMDSLEEVGGGSLSIHAGCVGDEVMLQFSDTGPGIREPERVFDPFYTTKPIGKGTGLGLSAVYGVVQEHNGHISCQNNPEGGALFVLRFPASTAPIAVQAGAAGA